MTEPRAWLYEHPEGHLNVSVSRDAHGTWEGWLERPLYGPEAADRIIALEAELKTVRDREADTHRRHDAKVDALEAEMARRDKSELRNCINWGPCSRNDDCMKGGPKLSRALMEKNDV